MMAYDKAFNTPLVLFTAFKGQMIADLSNLKWKSMSRSHFGFSAGSYTHLYSNGISFVARTYANSTNYYSYYDIATGQWVASFSLAYDIYCAENGIYLLCRNTASSIGSSAYPTVYASRDGKSYWYAGNLVSVRNPVMCAASNGSGGVISVWYVDNPVYAKGDVSSSSAWTMVGTFSKDGVCCFNDMTYHKGLYVGLASDTMSGSGKGGIQKSVDGYRWTRTLQYPYDLDKGNGNNFSTIRSVGNRLFLRLYYYPAGSSKIQYRLAILNNAATSYKVIMTGNDVPSLDAIVYAADLGLYVMFGDNTVYTSPDGYSWTKIQQTGFSGTKSQAIYISGVGFYVSTSGSYGSNSVYFCAYP